MSTESSSSRKRYVFVRNLPLFSTSDSLAHHFSDFGTVLSVRLLHKNGVYTRTASVKMGSSKSVKKILKHHPHTLDGKPIEVAEYLGEEIHIETFVEGRFIVFLKNLFSPGPFNTANIEHNAFQAHIATERLANAFHQSEYTQIDICMDVHGFYDGSATVTFLDGRNETRILEIAREAFGDCTITTRIGF